MDFTNIDFPTSVDNLKTEHLVTICQFGQLHTFIDNTLWSLTALVVRNSVINVSIFKAYENI